MSPGKRAQGRKLESKKRRAIIQAKKQAWITVVSNLNPGLGQSQLWPFTKSMSGKGTFNSADGAAILHNNETISSPQEKATLFLDLFSRISPSNIAQNAFYQSRINSAISQRSFQSLNSPITPEEVERCLKKSKSKAMGLDLINNYVG